MKTVRPSYFTPDTSYFPLDLPPALTRWLLALLVAASLGVRLWGLEAGLPIVYHPDEPDYVRIAQGIFKTGDLNPHAFNYPSLFFYLNTLAYLPFYAAGELFGAFDGRGDILTPVSYLQGITVAPLPEAFMLGRLLTVAFGVGSVLLVYLIGAHLLGSRWVGLLGALIFAVSPTNVVNSRLITPDTFLVFFILLAFWCVVQVYRHGGTRHFIYAGVAIGLVAGTKYNGVLIALTLVAALLLKRGWRGVLEPRLYLAGLLSAVTFLATTPFAIFDYPRFMADLSYEATHYSTGHLGMEGETLLFYLTHFRNYEGLIVLLGLVEVVRGIAARRKEIVLLSVFPVAYFLFINQFVVRNDRTLMPLLPFVYLLGASLIGWLAQAAAKWRGGSGVKAARWAAMAALGLVIATSLLFPLERMIALTSYRIEGINSRQDAMRWIGENVPPGSRVAIEAYSPYVDPGRYTVYGLTRMTEYPAQWYVDNRIEYLVFSKFTFQRIYNARDRFPEEARRYDEMFSTFEALKTFPHGDYEIRIYRVPGS
jgi:4-amino-4-deoxy-L-arabinose transferase-like glycosyltransferase